VPAGWRSPIYDFIAVRAGRESATTKFENASPAPSIVARLSLPVPFARNAFLAQQKDPFSDLPTPRPTISIHVQRALDANLNLLLSVRIAVRRLRDTIAFPPTRLDSARSFYERARKARFTVDRKRAK